MSAVVLAGVTSEVREQIVEALADSDAAIIEKDPQEGMLLPEGEDIELVVLGESISEPIAAAQRVGSQTGKSGVLIVVPPERSEGIERALRFSPLLSGDVRWVRSDQWEEIRENARSMVAKSRRRRRFSSTLSRLRDKMPERTPDDRTTVYLDALLDYAQMGVLVIDSSGKAVDLNVEARRYLVDVEGSARGRPVSDILPPSVRGSVSELIAGATSAGDGSVSERLLWDSDEEETYVEVTAVRLSKGGESARTMIILRDVTSEVHAERARWELREQRAVADALERQASELRDLNRELESRNEELQQFAYVASHDLQEPLRKIASFSDLLLEDTAEQLGEKGRFYVDRMQAAALRMSELIRGLLRFSRVRTESYDTRPMDLNQILEDVLTDLGISIEEAGAEIEVDELPIVKGDVGQLRQLFQNLISNSIKFRKPNQRPRIRVQAHPPENGGHPGHRITVADNGIGFDEKYADRIFSPFQRLHAGEDYPGTGMGLAICARIVERHGGKIDVESRPNEGTTFTIHLPAAPPVA